jgi:hypothetical protein
MATNWLVATDAVNIDLEGLDKDEFRRNVSRALNRVAASTRTAIADRVRAELNFPASFVAPSKGRLYQSGFSSPSKLEAEITATGRATSLARFVSGSTRLGQAGVSVQVKTGSSSTLARAFLMPLNKGLGPQTDGPKNRGLAIRLRKGESLSKTTAAKPLGKNLFLLYGPSVAQVFENNAGSGEKMDMTPEVIRRLQAEIDRLVKVEFNG